MWGHHEAVFMGRFVRLSRGSDKSIVWGWGYLHYISHMARDKRLSPLYELHHTQPTVSSSLKLYAHTHAQSHQVHETSYYVVNMCNYDGGRVGQIERDRDGRTQSLHESTVGGSHMGHIFKWAEPAQSIKLNVSVSTESVCYHQDESTDQWGQLTTPKLPSKNPVSSLLCSKDPVCVTLFKSLELHVFPISVYIQIDL